jgi:hypothetical protein
MGQMGRPGLSAAQKADLWQRWKQGQSLSEIGWALGKHEEEEKGTGWVQDPSATPVSWRFRERRSCIWDTGAK